MTEKVSWECSHLGRGALGATANSSLLPRDKRPLGPSGLATLRRSQFRVLGAGSSGLVDPLIGRRKASLHLFCFFFFFAFVLLCLGFSHTSVGKESACSAGEPGLIPGSGRAPEEGKGYPLQYSGLESPWTVCKVGPWGHDGPPLSSPAGGGSP